MTQCQVIGNCSVQCGCGICATMLSSVKQGVMKLGRGQFDIETA
jgi:hypothetical protein